MSDVRSRTTVGARYIEPSASIEAAALGRPTAPVAHRRLPQRTKRDTRASTDADQATARVQRRDPDVLYRPRSTPGKPCTARLPRESAGGKRRLRTLPGRAGHGPSNPNSLDAELATACAEPVDAALARGTGAVASAEPPRKLVAAPREAVGAPRLATR
jgi:hypothetical protein